MSSIITRVWQDFGRRRVFRVAAIYAASAWLIVQVAGEIVPALYLPDWILAATVVVAIVGFPVAVILGWVFDIGPDGLVRTRPGSAKGMAAIVTSIAFLGGGMAAFVSVVLPRQDVASTTADTDSFSPITNSLAVIPFADLSTSSNEARFAEDVAEVLIQQLGRAKQLHVIARESSFEFDSEDTDSKEIGRKLNVSQVLKGSVQREEDNLRVAAQLIDTRTGSQTWTQMFDVNESQLFELQDEIVLAVAKAMKISLSETDKKRVTNRTTSSFDAYNYYLMGQNELWHSFDFESSLKKFQQATAVDPEFALGYAGMADSYVFAAFFESTDSADALAKARKSIDKALSLDPFLAEAHAADIAYYNISADLERASEAFKKATSLNPSYVHSYTWFGNALIRAGHLTEAQSVLERAESLNPLHPQTKTNLAWIQWRRGDTGEAIRLEVEAVEIAKSRKLPDWTGFLAYAGGTQSTVGRYDVTIACVQAAINFGEPVTGWTAGLLMMSYLNLGDFDAAGYWRGRLDEAEASFFGDFSKVYFHLKSENSPDDEALWRLLTERTKNNIGTAPGRDYAALAAELAIYSSRYDDAIEYLEYVVKDSPSVQLLAQLAFVLDATGKPAEAKEQIDRASKMLIEEQKQGLSDAEFWKGVISLRAVEGDARETLDAVREFYEYGSLEHLWLSTEPLLEFVRDNREFQQIVSAMKSDLVPKRQRVIEARESGTWRDLIPFDIGSEKT